MIVCVLSDVLISGHVDAKTHIKAVTRCPDTVLF